MKIAVITIHFGINYGSALQAYALTRFLKNEGHTVSLINYIPERYSFGSRNIKVLKESGKLKGIIKLVGGIPSRLIYDSIFNKFLKEYTPLSHKIKTVEELEKEFGDYDALIAGSDQIWNSDYNEGINSAYFLSFAGVDSIKISYAASCGKGEFSDNEKQIMQILLKRFNGVSVREKSMVPLMRELGVINPVHVLDPVLLVREDVWDGLKQKKSINRRYLFIYLLDGDVGETVNKACLIAKQRNLETVMISFGHVWSRDKRVDHYLIHQSPENFIDLIRGADFVVTNSFHGMAFSIEFNKQFVAFKRKAYNSRLESLAKLFGVEGNLKVPYEMDVDAIDNINYSEINKKLETMRDISSEYLIRYKV